MLKQLLQLPSPLTALKFLCDHYQLKPSPILKEVSSTFATEKILSAGQQIAISHTPTENAQLPVPSEQAPSASPSHHGSQQKLAASIAPSTEQPWYLIHTKPRQEASSTIRRLCNISASRPAWRS